MQICQKTRSPWPEILAHFYLAACRIKEFATAEMRAGRKKEMGKKEKETPIIYYNNLPPANDVQKQIMPGHTWSQARGKGTKI